MLNDRQRLIVQLTIETSADTDPGDVLAAVQEQLASQPRINFGKLLSIDVGSAGSEHGKESK